MRNLIHLSGKLNSKNKKAIEKILKENKGCFFGSSDKGALFEFETPNDMENFIKEANKINDIYLDRQ